MQLAADVTAVRPPMTEVELGCSDCSQTPLPRSEVEHGLQWSWSAVTAVRPPTPSMTEVELGCSRTPLPTLHDCNFLILNRMITNSMGKTISMQLRSIETHRNAWKDRRLTKYLHLPWYMYDLTYHKQLKKLHQNCFTSFNPGWDGSKGCRDPTPRPAKHKKIWSACAIVFLVIPHHSAKFLDPNDYWCAHAVPVLVDGEIWWNKCKRKLATVFYLLYYIASAEISKFGDQKKQTNPVMYSTPAEFFITFLTTFQKSMRYAYKTT